MVTLACKPGAGGLETGRPWGSLASQPSSTSKAYVPLQVRGKPDGTDGIQGYPVPPGALAHLHTQVTNVELFPLLPSGQGDVSRVIDTFL